MVDGTLPTRPYSAQEEWRTVPDFPDYEVSSIGRVRRATSRTVGKAGHLLKQSQRGPTGHVTVQLWRLGKSKTITVSRLIALAFLGDPPSPRHQAAHNDSRPTNNILSNIRWASPSENAADKVGNKTQLFGETHAMVILTEDQVREIRRQRSAGATLDALGKTYGVHLGTIWAIVHRKTWRHV